MKKLLVALLFVVCLSTITTSVKAQYLTYEPAYKPIQIENGWYKAGVKYFNSSTYTKSNYTLKVRIEYGKVTAIDFGNGGSVHTGLNNEGYLYTGGTLSYIKDYEGNLTGVSTRVTISDRNGLRTFDITL